jgi:hypothetical protein
MKIRPIKNAPFRRSALLGGEQRPGNSAGEGSTEFTPGELPIDRENAGEPHGMTQKSLFFIPGKKQTESFGQQGFGKCWNIYLLTSGDSCHSNSFFFGKNPQKNVWFDHIYPRF